MFIGLKWDKPGIIIVILVLVAVLLDLYGPIETAAYIFILLGAIAIYRWWTKQYLN